MDLHWSSNCSPRFLSAAGEKILLVKSFMYLVKRGHWFPPPPLPFPFCLFFDELKTVQWFLRGMLGELGDACSVSYLDG